MKRLKVHIRNLLIAGIVLICACNEEAEPYRNEPAVKLRFFNIDSLTKVNAAIAGIDAEVASLTAENTALATLVNSLNTRLAALDELIASGRDDLAAEREAVAAEIAAAAGLQATISTSLETRNVQKALLTKTLATINSGKVLLRSIEANGRTIEYADSATVFSLPINMNAASQVYYLEVGNRRDSLELSYNVEEELTERSYIKLIATNIERTEGKYSYDSVAVYCKSLPEPCVSNETTINIYF